MFGRSAAYERNVSNIGNHLKGIQIELGKIGNQATRRTSDAGADQVQQLIAAIAPVLEDLASLFRRSQSYAAGRASDVGRKSLDTGNKVAQHMLTQTEEQPGLMLAIALGIGMLIGFSARRLASK